MEARTKEQGSGTRTLLIVLLVLCGVILVSCLVCVVGSRISKHFEQNKEVKVAEKLLEEGKIGEAEKKFKKLGEYDKHKKDIEEKKKEEHARLVREANKAYEERNFELAVKLYGEAQGFGSLDEAAQAQYKKAEVFVLKTDVPKYLADAKGHLESDNYDTALEEANKVIEGCNTLEENAPPVAKEINTKRIRKEALALKETVNKEKVKAEREEAMERDPSRFVTIKSSWYIGGFGTVAIHKVTVKNECSFPIKNIALAITYYTGGRDKCDYAQYTIMDKVPANSTKVFRDINAGFVNSQAKTCSVELLGVERY
jgi:tetratricopeptide (TPR) repeat protein